jgi:hypothetical protein
MQQERIPVQTHLMESLEVALAARRAIVLLFVGWSIYPRRALAILKSATPKLESLEITFAVIDEESPGVRAWLSEHGPESLKGDYPQGWGSVFWLEAGCVVDFESGSENPTLYELLVRTRHRWTATSAT